MSVNRTVQVSVTTLCTLHTASHTAMVMNPNTGESQNYTHALLNISPCSPRCACEDGPNFSGILLFRSTESVVFGWPLSNRRRGPFSPRPAVLRHHLTSGRRPRKEGHVVGDAPAAPCPPGSRTAQNTASQWDGETDPLIMNTIVVITVPL